jgi:hypothetical protein
MRRAQPAFEPARPVIAVCVRPPVDTDVEHLVGDPVTARVLDVFNVAYEVLLYVLGRFFGHGHETDEQLQTLADVAVELMVRVIRPVGELVTTLPVGSEYPGATAGPSFEVFYRSGYLLPHTYSSWVLLHERLLELRGFLEKSIEMGAPSELAGVARDLDSIAAKLASQMQGLDDRDVLGPPAHGVGAVAREEA